VIDYEFKFITSSLTNLLRYFGIEFGFVTDEFKLELLGVEYCREFNLYGLEI
jgi:hypothetical protein